jgi:hypothetical protein
MGKVKDYVGCYQEDRQTPLLINPCLVTSAEKSCLTKIQFFFNFPSYRKGIRANNTLGRSCDLAGAASACEFCVILAKGQRWEPEPEPHQHDIARHSFLEKAVYNKILVLYCICITNGPIMKKYVNKNGQFTVTSVKDFTSGH